MLGGDLPGAVLGFGGTLIGGNICEKGCTDPGGPCCQVQCTTVGGACCASGQLCCSGGSGIICCDGGATCTKDSNNLYNWCCPGGDAPMGCSAFGGTTLWLACRRPGQSCCGPWNPCDVGQYCANAEYGICCPTGQSFCAGSCCDGECITYTAGTVKSQFCCSKPQVLCGATDVGPICCAPNNCQKSATGKQICCPQPLCGGEVCCEPPATCQ